MIKKSLDIILNVFAWMFGIVFLISSISELSNGNILFAIGLLFGALLLLPPIKKLIINKIPKLNRWMITSFASVVILACIGIFAPKTAPENAVEIKNESAVVKKAVDKPAVLAKNIIPKPIDQQPKTLLNQENTEIEDVKPKMDKVEVIKSESKPEPKKIADIPRTNDCSGLPRTCGKMANCAQARKALACGNGKLDRDNDGIPCESIC